MSSLHHIAIEHYAEHYARVNPTIDVSKLPRRTYRNMERMFGSLVDRLAPGQTVVDLGCGVGFFLHWLSTRKHLTLKGVELSESQAICARRGVPGAEVTHEDALTFMEGRDAEFGAVFCMDMLEHLETDDQCLHLLRGVHSSLQKGGFFVCRVPNAAHILGSYHRYIDITHHRSFTVHSLEQTFAAAGFREVRFIPHRSSSFLGAIRLGLEYLLHKGLFLLAGYTRSNIYTFNVTAVGFKA